MMLRSPGVEGHAPSTKLRRTNSSRKLAGNLERTLSFKNWEAEAARGSLHGPANGTPASPLRRINGARPGRLALQSPKSRASGIASPGALAQVGVPEACSPAPRCELDEAATKVQKVFKGHRTRRSLADCAIVIEELWWKLYDSASLDRKSISFFRGEKQETAASRWARAGKRIAKVGKGLSKNEKAQKLALRHWLEAIDPRHRYGHNLHLYYDFWFESSSTEPFFYWLDIGAGRDIHHPKCPRSRLHSQLVMYLGTTERAAYEVTVEDGKLLYRQSGVLVNTTDDSKWIFVLSTTRSLYVGQKKKGKFQHSSFLAGGATTAAGRLVAEQGVLKAIWPYSGHYLPTEENFIEFISFLEEKNVDLTNVKRCSVDDDVYPSFKNTSSEPSEEAEKPTEATHGEALDKCPEEIKVPEVDIVKEAAVDDSEGAKATPKLASRPSLKWTTGAGARIGCVRDYPADLQSMALEQVNLSPRVVPSPSANKIPIPSPRPSPRIRLSPRLQYMGIPAPTGSKVLVPSPGIRQSPKQQHIGILTPTVRLTLPKNKGK